MMPVVEVRGWQLLSHSPSLGAELLAFSGIRISRLWTATLTSTNWFATKGCVRSHSGWLGAFAALERGEKNNPAAGFCQQTNYQISSTQARCCSGWSASVSRRQWQLATLPLAAPSFPEVMSTRGRGGWGVEWGCGEGVGVGSCCGWLVKPLLSVPCADTVDLWGCTHLSIVCVCTRHIEP